MGKSNTMTDDTHESGSPNVAPLRRFAHEAMACTFEAALVCDDARYAGQVARAVFDEIDRLERELSRFVPTSDVARLNALRPGESLQLGADALECLRLAEQMCRETGGAFDVTYASRVKPTRDQSNRCTTTASQDHANANAASPLLEIDPEHHCARVHAVGVHVDLGGIGKGFALDRALDVLREWGISAALIHAGQSSVFAFGTPVNNKSNPSATWRIALRDPLEPARIRGRVRLADAALSGSGRKLHGDHIIDPRTGQAATAKIAAWAAAPSAAVADALSTAFMVMPPAAIESYCRQNPTVAALIAREEAGTVNYVRWGANPWELEPQTE